MRCGANTEIEQGDSQRDDRQDFQRKDELFHVVGVYNYEIRGAADRLAEQVVNQETDEQCHGEVDRRLPCLSPSRTEDRSKHEAVDRRHQQCLDDVPANSTERTLVTRLDLALCEGLDE